MQRSNKIVKQNSVFLFGLLDMLLRLAFCSSPIGGGGRRYGK
jgi:hypothetical protein